MELVIQEMDTSLNKKRYPQTICLNMIVKNEAHVIKGTLEHLLSKIPITYWVISDTGSTDGTQDLIRRFFKERGIPGELVEHSWRDFGYNRTKALECAYNKTDYLFIFDADDSIGGNFVMPPSLVYDKYDFIFGRGFTYHRPLLVNNRLRWMFRGVLHEFLANVDPIKSSQVFPGDYFIESGRAGARNKDPDKYLKDAIILKNAFEEEVKLKDGLSGRYAFYCAQSYKDCNHVDDAIEWYLKCLELDVWIQEKYHSCLMLGEMYDKKGDSYNMIKYLLKAAEYDSERIDGVVFAMKKFNKDQIFVASNALYHKYKNYKKNLEGKLFLYDFLYKDEMEFENSVAAFYCKDFDSGYLCCKQLLSNQITNIIFLIVTVNNLQFYKDYIQKDNDTLALFYGLDKVLNEMVNRGDNIHGHTLEIWNLLFQKNKELLMDMEKSKKEIVNLCLKFRDIFVENNKYNSTTDLSTTSTKNKIIVANPNVVVTFTTCKRLDLFQQTIDSILNHWLNPEKVDYWFCVDDNSSEEDRQMMRNKYGWIDYYMKGVEEKGHRKSMNIIWDKLNDLQPTYWIHIEDDFLFHNKMDYVEEGIRGINTMSSENVKQVIFNLNYGEIIENYYGKSHINKNNGFSVHDYKNGNFPYQNCHYWPHFSFRPGITDVKSILALGNFDSPNEFFEMDYAIRWTNAGYKTGFFNKITCRHIGRLTSERTDPNKPNAYNLNNEGQYMMGGKSSQMIKKEPKTYIQIVNLEKRVDRKEKTEKYFKEQGFQEKIDYQFIKAVDGFSLEPTLELKKLFEGNDFGSRRGVIGCALSHYYLWKELLVDDYNDYYLIFEDDFDFAKIDVDDGVKEKRTMKNILECLKPQMKEKECIFFGYHMFEKHRMEKMEKYGSLEKSLSSEDQILMIEPLDKSNYIGGTFCYSINKKGAKQIVDYIEQNGIKHGIDYVMKICNKFITHELQKQIVFSEWNEAGKNIDSDIQFSCESMDFSSIFDIKEHFIFIPGLDQFGYDIFFDRKSLEESMDIAWKRDDCVAFNTLGFFKDKIDKFSVSQYFGENDGIWIKKEFYEKKVFVEKQMMKNTVEYLDQFTARDEKEEEIDKNNKKNYCFIHSCHLADVGVSSLNYILSLLVSSGVLDYLEKVFVINNGVVIDENKNLLEVHHEKIKILQYSQNTYLYEKPTLELLHQFCEKNDSSNILYLHTKGITRDKNDNRIKDWISMMMYFLTNRSKTCISLLNEYDAVGCNLSKTDCYGNEKPHFSGNFWWARANYLKTLNTNYLKKKEDDEFWLLSGLNQVKTFELYASNVNHYIEEHPREKYVNYQIIFEEENVKDNVEEVFAPQLSKKWIRIKMLCNWCSSEQLCKDWSNMCEDPASFTWKNLQITWENENIDYYVIINKPQGNDYYEPSKTIVFQMEPWVNDMSKPWGVKTWDQWAIPDKNKFLAVRGRHSDCWNNAYWQLELTLNELEKLDIESINKRNAVSSICSSKYFDEGHILRIDFLKYIEQKLSESVDFELDIYNVDNDHHFKNYRGKLDPYVDKSKGMVLYKYYFMMENNFEENFITEKIWEPILCETLVFYYGCPNVSKYINPLAYVQLDINDFEKSYQIVKKAIEEDWWSQRLNIIREEKKKILNDLAFFPTINMIINK